MRNYTSSFFNQTLSRYLVELGEDSYNKLVTVVGLSEVGESIYNASSDAAIMFLNERTPFFVPILMQYGKLLDPNPGSTELFKSTKRAKESAEIQANSMLTVWQGMNKNLKLIIEANRVMIVDEEKKVILLMALVVKCLISNNDTCLKYESAVGPDKLPVVAVSAHESHEEAARCIRFNDPMDVKFFDNLFWVEE